MRITLFVPCFIDVCFPRVGVSVVEVLERLGHTVEFASDLPCCGQPGFNSGCWPEARLVARKVLKGLEKAEAVVIPSGSCGAMLKVFYPQLFESAPEVEAARELSAKTFEFSDFLVTRLGVTDVGARFEKKVTFHDGCHGLRELHTKSQPRKLLEHVRGLELVEMQDVETCCGFGGTFAAKFPKISTAMGENKCAAARDTGAEWIVSNDSSCLMHIQGLIDRRGEALKTIHLAEVLNSR